MLIVQGDNDMQVSPHDADLLGDAMQQSERMKFAQGTHMLKADVAGNPFATYADPALPLHENLVPGIAGFIGGAAISE
ncbi:hypothetical protein [Cereibacter johrii]|uniref:hypothetical protein n=1 Tax=Cereibacter johrii TaxID=445629 RepID=UPI001969DD3C|nr:hypothetical protein [Cereibacter johrii]